jgi:hypothetical protein
MREIRGREKRRVAAGSITADTHTDKNAIGRQPISNALRIDCAANFGVTASTNVSAPEAFNLTIWESMGVLDFVGRNDGIVVAE